MKISRRGFLELFGASAAAVAFPVKASGMSSLLSMVPDASKVPPAVAKGSREIIEIVVKAPDSNLGPIWIGASERAVRSRHGIRLDPGCYITMQISDSIPIAFDVEQKGDGIQVRNYKLS